RRRICGGSGVRLERFAVDVEAKRVDRRGRPLGQQAQHGGLDLVRERRAVLGRTRSGLRIRVERRDVEAIRGGDELSAGDLGVAREELQTLELDAQRAAQVFARVVELGRRIDLEGAEVE